MNNNSTTISVDQRRAGMDKRHSDEQLEPDDAWIEDNGNLVRLGQ